YIEVMNEKYAGREVIVFGHQTFAKALQILLKPDLEAPFIDRRASTVVRGMPLHLTAAPDSLPPTVAIVGAGAIARGYVADIFDRAGYALTFVGNDRDRQTLAKAA